VKALLLDLDETLVPDYAHFLAAAQDVAEAHGAPAGIATAIGVRARGLWHGAPESTRARMTDISSWEALWAPFPADLGDWAEAFRLDAWHDALRDHDVDDRGLAQRLARSYRDYRIARCRPYPEVVATLDALRGRVRLAVVTNGMEQHQRSKLDAAGLTDRFDAIVTSAAAGTSKPDPRIFRRALEQVGVAAAEAVMVGDNVLRDVAGAQTAGLRAVWLDRDGGDDHGVRPDARVTDLGGVLALGW